MTNYIIEDNIDFYAELYKSLDDDNNNNDNNADAISISLISNNTNNTNEENICLISNEPLIENFVELPCNHKFNYIPLFHDIKNHKQIFNNMEGKSTHLNHNEIRCPYCRNKSFGILPYYPDMELPKIHGVNYLNLNNKLYHHQTFFKICQFLKPNPNYIENNNNPTSFVNNKFLVCNKIGTQINYCINTQTTEGENYNDTQFYCCSHKKFMIKKYQKAFLLQNKEEAKLAKQQAKEAAKLAKLKSSKKQLKEPVTKIEIVEEDNTITHLNPALSSHILYCSELLKTGLRKGLPCNCKAFAFQDNKCKRHFTPITPVTPVTLIVEE
jgi:hypothetical protein